MFRNLIWAAERVSERGGVRTREGRRKLQLVRYDSKGQVEEALSMMRSAIDEGARTILQGSSSAVAAALIDAINKHNSRIRASPTSGCYSSDLRRARSRAHEREVARWPRGVHARAPRANMTCVASP